VDILNGRNAEFGKMLEHVVSVSVSVKGSVCKLECFISLPVIPGYFKLVQSSSRSREVADFDTSSVECLRYLTFCLLIG
jgi:hypothetical protein